MHILRSIYSFACQSYFAVLGAINFLAVDGTKERWLGSGRCASKPHHTSTHALRPHFDPIHPPAGLGGRSEPQIECAGAAVEPQSLVQNYRSNLVQPRSQSNHLALFTRIKLQSQHLILLFIRESGYTAPRRNYLHPRKQSSPWSKL
jgi:hypothetical protein